VTPRSTVLWVACLACAGRARAPSSDRIAIVASERGPQGARLVSIDEHGDRQFELVEPAAALARDTNPAVSPDGAWIVFASSRGRGLDETSLWIAPAGVARAPRRLTDGKGIDSQPVWTPDGRAIVFASTRARGDFDLWRLEIRGGEPTALTQLTDAPGHEVTPAVAVHRLTSGPADSSPALSPDGARLVFARPQLHGGKPDSELWLMVRGTDRAAPLVDLPLTDESGPVWSRDGRFVFATSVLRGADARVLFSSVIYVDTRESPPIARILEDRVGAIARLTPAVTATPLDAAALHTNPEYLPELAHIMQTLIEQQTQGQDGEHSGRRKSREGSP
jgi:Tol biopolymer transport system component